MSTKQFRRALELAREGRMDEAIALLRAMEIGFLQKRFVHYRAQPDHREAAARLESAWRAAQAEVAKPGRPPALPVQDFVAPLPPANVEKAPEVAITFEKPEEFLAWVSGDWDKVPRLDLARIQYMDVWALVALGSLLLEGRSRSLYVLESADSGGARFAHALGLGALAGRQVPTYDEPTRTVSLTRVRKFSEIEPIAERMAAMVVTDPAAESTRRAVRYVLVELLRNVLQHSADPLGAVAAAQRMDTAQRRARPMIQVAVADAGIGIPRSLREHHPHLVDYRQALERALLPHISGTFPEGLTGTLDNAGLGLYMITEMTRQTGGRLLIATTGAALTVQPGSGDVGSPRFIQPKGTGFPGTLVAFEIPTDAVQDYTALIRAISAKASERTPRRASDRWLNFGPGPADAVRLAMAPLREDTPAARQLSQERIRPALVGGQQVELDFAGIDLCTQSWLHALLYEPVRLAWALRVPIHVVNADPAVQEGLRFLEAYALGG